MNTDAKGAAKARRVLKTGRRVGAKTGETDSAKVCAKCIFVGEPGKRTLRQECFCGEAGNKNVVLGACLWRNREESVVLSVCLREGRERERCVRCLCLRGGRKSTFILLQRIGELFELF